jgi:hypothetical protein
LTAIGLSEPTTMLTDYAMAALAAAFAVRLGLGARGEGPAGKVKGAIAPWRLAFGAAALAAVVGGTSHGFRLSLGEVWHARVWRLTVALIVLSAAVTLGAAIRSVLRPAIAAEEGRRIGRRWLWRGLFVTLVGVAIQQSGWVFHTHFNHNDLYHLVQTVGLYCLYRGARVLEGLEEAA